MFEIFHSSIVSTFKSSTLQLYSPLCHPLSHPQSGNPIREILLNIYPKEPNHTGHFFGFDLTSETQQDPQKWIFSLLCSTYRLSYSTQPINTAVKIMIHGFILEQLCIGIRKNEWSVILPCQHREQGILDGFDAIRNRSHIKDILKANSDAESFISK